MSITGVEVGASLPVKTLKALRGSIAKWEGIVAGTVEDKGPDNCPLCQLFWIKSACAGCPVYERTGEINCGDTPYDDYSAAQDDEDEIAMAFHAKAELHFLKSLLPAEAQSDEPVSNQP